NATAIPKFEGHIDPCDGGFTFVNPPPEDSKDSFSIKNNTKVKCEWSGSKVDTVSDFELFTSEGEQTILWQDGVKMENNSASVNIRIYVPTDTKLPATFFGRSWASSGEHNCLALT
ncbi:20207_t:CDS:2, partial [Racocetra persica]